MDLVTQTPRLPFELLDEVIGLVHNSSNWEPSDSVNTLQACALVGSYVLPSVRRRVFNGISISIGEHRELSKGEIPQTALHRFLSDLQDDPFKGNGSRGCHTSLASCIRRVQIVVGRKSVPDHVLECLSALLDLITFPTKAHFVYRGTTVQPYLSATSGVWQAFSHVFNKGTLKSIELLGICDIPIDDLVMYSSIQALNLTRVVNPRIGTSTTALARFQCLKVDLQSLPFLSALLDHPQADSIFSHLEEVTTVNLDVLDLSKSKFRLLTICQRSLCRFIIGAIEPESSWFHSWTTYKLDLSPFSALKAVVLVFKDVPPESLSGECFIPLWSLFEGSNCSSTLESVELQIHSSLDSAAVRNAGISVQSASSGPGRWLQLDTTINGPNFPVLKSISIQFNFYLTVPTDVVWNHQLSQLETRIDEYLTRTLPASFGTGRNMYAVETHVEVNVTDDATSDSSSESE